MHASVNQTITNDPDLLLNSEAGAGESVAVVETPYPWNVTVSLCDVS